LCELPQRNWSTEYPFRSCSNNRYLRSAITQTRPFIIHRILALSFLVVFWILIPRSMSSLKLTDFSHRLLDDGQLGYAHRETWCHGTCVSAFLERRATGLSHAHQRPEMLMWSALQLVRQLSTHCLAKRFVLVYVRTRLSTLCRRMPAQSSFPRTTVVLPSRLIRMTTLSFFDDTRATQHTARNSQRSAICNTQHILKVPLANMTAASGSADVLTASHSILLWS
jgi:hypothetical protein